MLEADPTKRISAEDALNHPFFKQGEHLNRRRKASIDHIKAEKDSSSDIEEYFKEEGNVNGKLNEKKTEEKEILLNRNRASSF